MRGIFSDNVDRLGGQAKTNSRNAFQQTGYFCFQTAITYPNFSKNQVLANHRNQLRGRVFVLTGDVSEFGRKKISG